MTQEKILSRIEGLLSIADSATKRTYEASYVRYVGNEGFFEFRAASLSLFESLTGINGSFYKEFRAATDNNRLTSLQAGVGVLKAFKQEVKEGWFQSFKGLVSAEIFTDFLDMSSHLLQEGYKDPAAVMIGSVLEEHLRQLCDKNDIDTFIADAKTGKEIPKKADRMNNDLAVANVYNKLYQKNILGWLDLRNKAAHGHYSEYDARQVELMEAGVTDFMAKTS
jgi:hypothetical protein